MSTRAYQMRRRTESAQDTRQRIVRAAYELHSEKGIAATSMRDIAERANVAVGSVYHHFPRYDDVVQACGAYTVDLTRPPTPALLDGAQTHQDRLQVLVQSVFDFYARFEGLERIRADRAQFAALAEFLDTEQSNRRAMLRHALAPRRPGKPAIALAMAMLDVAFYRSLIAEGLAHAKAVQATAELLHKLLLDETAATPRAAVGRRP